MEELTVNEAPLPDDWCCSYNENEEVELCNKENENSGTQLSPLDASFADEETEGVADQVKNVKVYSRLRCNFWNVKILCCSYSVF